MIRQGAKAQRQFGMALHNEAKDISAHNFASMPALARSQARYGYAADRRPFHVANFTLLENVEFAA